MSFKKAFTTGVASLVLIAGNAATFAGAAQAENWRNGPSQYRSERNWNDGRRDDGGRYAYDGRGYDGRGYHKKDKSDKKIARGVAIGLGVLLIGSILASQSHR